MGHVAVGWSIFKFCVIIFLNGRVGKTLFSTKRKNLYLPEESAMILKLFSLVLHEWAFSQSSKRFWLILVQSNTAFVVLGWGHIEFCPCNTVILGCWLAFGGSSVCRLSILKLLYSWFRDQIPIRLPSLDWICLPSEIRKKELAEGPFLRECHKPWQWWPLFIELFPGHLVVLYLGYKDSAL